MTEEKFRFQATIGLHGKTATGISVPADVVEGMGAGKRPAVRVTIDGYSYRSTIAKRDEKYLVGVSAANRDGAGVVAGDEVEVEIEVDTEPRVIAVPDDLQQRLDADRGAAEFFAQLSHSQKQWYVLPIEGAKKTETRERRLEKAMTMLGERRKR